jgi:hypothetical protein
MTHYVCRGENCKTSSERPSICLEPSCLNRYKLLDECNCRDKKTHGKSVSHVHHHGGVNPTVMGVAVGSVAAVYFFLIGVTATYLGWGGEIVTAFSTIFIGYDATLVGSFAGGLWALIEWFALGVIMAFVYNTLHRVRG